MNICSAITWFVFYVANLILRLEFWGGIKYNEKLTLFFLLIGIGGVINASMHIMHNYIHVYYFELFSPPPYVGMISGTCTTWLLPPILFLRYHHT